MRLKKSGLIAVLALVVLTAALVSGAALAAKGGNGNGNGGGNGGGPPGGGSCNNCPEEIDLGNGLVCTLDACGSDCVYSCPLP